MTAGNELVAQLNAALPETAEGRAEWDERESALIDLARRQADDIEQLEALLRLEGSSVVGSTGQSRMNPAFAELRQQRLALAKILTGLRLPDEGYGSSANRQQASAATARWKGKGGRHG